MQFLSLSSNIGTVELKVIAACLPQCKNLEEVWISNGNQLFSNPEVTRDSADNLACYNQFLSLKRLKFTNNKFGNTGVEWLASILCRCRGIQHLDLSGNRIASSGAEAIFTSIQNVGTLQSFLTMLDLSDNEIGRKGAYICCLQMSPVLA